MKKIFGTILVAVTCLLLAAPAQAQLKFGVKGGVNMAKIDWAGGVDGNKENTAGFFIGPMAEVTIPIVGLGVDAAVLYSQRGKEDWKQQGVEIPVNLKYTIGLGSTFGIFVAAGPDFYFNFKDSDMFEKENKQIGLNVGAGLKLVRHLQVGVNYQFPLSDSYKGVDTKVKTWQVSLAYLF